MCNHPNREAAMVTLYRACSGEPLIWCDPCIAPLVKALNEAGMATVWSCCGHGSQPSVVGLADGRQVVVLNVEQHRRIAALFPDVNAVPPATITEVEQ